MTLRAFVVLGCFVAASLAASLCVAQDAPPYSAHEFSRSELIDFGTYDKFPLSFDLKTLEVSQEPVGDHINFVVTVDAPYRDVVEHFRNAYKSHKTVARLDPDLFPMQTSRDLEIIGHTALEGSRGPVGFTLRAKAMTRRFTVRIHEERGKGVLTMRNLVRSQLFSGAVPARVGFKPEGADPVNLLWN